jgi:hypothetical protein
MPRPLILARIPHVVRRVARICGIDRAIYYVLLGRGWGVLAGPLTLFLIGKFLRPDEQGYYYTFNSVIALNVFFELGLGYVLVQCASHERAALEWHADRTLAGDLRARQRLSSLVLTAARWYGVACTLGVLCIVPVGLWFFRSHSVAYQVSWQGPWIVVGAAAAATLLANPLVAIVEGCGHVHQVVGLRTIQSVAATLLLWAVLIGHGGLFACAAYQLAFATTVWLFLVIRYRRFYSVLLRTPHSANALDWRAEVWPFQWRIALSWMSGYLIFQLYTPAMFAYCGPVEAGQMGMSMTLVNAIQNLCFSWITTKAAIFGMLVARRSYAELDRLFFRTAAQSFVLLLLALGAALVVVVLLSHYRLPFAKRLLPPGTVAVLGCNVAINHIIFCLAVYLRAHKKEPMLWLSIIGGVLTALCVVLAARLYGAPGVAAGTLFLNLAYGLPTTAVVFVRRRREWHAPDSPVTPGEETGRLPA